MQENITLSACNSKNHLKSKVGTASKKHRIIYKSVYEDNSECDVQDDSTTLNSHASTVSLHNSTKLEDTRKSLL